MTNAERNKLLTQWVGNNSYSSFDEFKTAFNDMRSSSKAAKKKFSGIGEKTLQNFYNQNLDINASIGVAPSNFDYNTMNPNYQPEVYAPEMADDVQSFVGGKYQKAASTSDYVDGINATQHMQNNGLNPDTGTPIGSQTKISSTQYEEGFNRASAPTRSVEQLKQIDERAAAAAKAAQQEYVNGISGEEANRLVKLSQDRAAPPSKEFATTEDAMEGIIPDANEAELSLQFRQNKLQEQIQDLHNYGQNPSGHYTSTQLKQKVLDERAQGIWTDPSTGESISDEAIDTYVKQYRQNAVDRRNLFRDALANHPRGAALREARKVSVQNAQEAYKNLANKYIDRSVGNATSKEAYIEAANAIGITDLDFGKAASKDAYRQVVQQAIEDKAEIYGRVSSHSRAHIDTKALSKLENSRLYEQEAALLKISNRTESIANIARNANGYDAATTMARKEVQAASHKLPGKMGWKGRAAIFTVAALATTAVAGMMFAGGKRDNAQLYNPNAAFQYA